jgi:hypothetical protein
MICPVANCRKDVQPFFPTGLQEIIAMRIHLARDHQHFRDTLQVLQMRVDDEASKIEPKGVVRIDTDDEQNEKWLG